MRSGVLGFNRSDDRVEVGLLLRAFESYDFDSLLLRIRLEEFRDTLPIGGLVVDDVGGLALERTVREL